MGGKGSGAKPTAHLKPEGAERIIRNIEPDRLYSSAETAKFLMKSMEALKNDRYYRRTSLKYIKPKGGSVYYPGRFIIEYLEEGVVDPTKLDPRKKKR